MPRELVGLEVFIASPGGLKPERSSFTEIIERVNHEHAHAMGITFVPRGWEYASSGMGRPQEIINQQVRSSDYMIVILWDQWGQPPADSGYTSGTEEEYSVAIECLKDPKLPMRDVVVLFKGVNDRQLADPGDDLKKVLAFKEELEKSRALLYSTFDSLEEFKEDFRSHLHQWIRDWHGGPPPKKTSSEGPPVAVRATETDTRSDDVATRADMPASEVVRAKEAARRGRLTLAEQLYAQATKGQYNREAYTEYVRFLRKYGRLSAAQTTARTFLEIAQDSDDHIGEVEALANLSIISRHQGRNSVSMDYLNRAIIATNELLDILPENDIRARSDAIGTKAFLLDNQSLTLRRMPGRIQEALSKLDEARECQKQAGDRRGEGFTLRNKGTLQLRLGALEEAQVLLEEALEIFELVGYENGQAAVLGALGELFEAREDYESAIDRLDRSIAVSPQRVPSRNAGNYGILSRVHLKAGNLDDAKEYADQCSIFGKELGTPDSQATALRAEGAVALETGRLDTARASLGEALELFESVGNPIGITSVLLDMVRLNMRDGNKTAAAQLLSRAQDTIESTPHFVLQRDIDRARAELDHE